MPDDQQNPQLVRRVIHKPPSRVQGPGWHFEAVFGPDGEIQLFDIYIGNKWHGSRRTDTQCYHYLRQAGAEGFV
jgi:hypothetical protein